MASLSQGRTAAAQCGLITHKSVPVIFEPPCTFPSTLLSNTMTHFLHGTKCKVVLTIKTTTRSALNLAWNVRPVRRANLTTLREKSLPPSSEFLHHSDGVSRLLRSTDKYLPAYRLPVPIRENSESGIEITTTNLS